jgi:hypothetical protein
MTAWLSIGILALICAIAVGYVYLVEYRGGGSFEPAPADQDDDTVT